MINFTKFKANTDINSHAYAFSKWMGEEVKLIVVASCYVYSDLSPHVCVCSCVASTWFMKIVLLFQNTKPFAYIAVTQITTQNIWIQYKHSTANTEQKKNSYIF